MCVRLSNNIFQQQQRQQQHRLQLQHQQQRQQAHLTDHQQHQQQAHQHHQSLQLQLHHQFAHHVGLLEKMESLVNQIKIKFMSRAPQVVSLSKLINASGLRVCSNHYFHILELEISHLLNNNRVTDSF